MSSHLMAWVASLFGATIRCPRCSHRLVDCGKDVAMAVRVIPRDAGPAPYAAVVACKRCGSRVELLQRTREGAS